MANCCARMGRETKTFILLESSYWVVKTKINIISFVVLFLKFDKMCCRQFDFNLEVEVDNDPSAFGASKTDRKCTDVVGLVIMVVYFATVIGLTCYCISNSDILKLLNGYDDCGNVCGKNNIKTDAIPYECFGANMEKKLYVLMDEGNKTCDDTCGDETIHYCMPMHLIPLGLFILKMWDTLLISLAPGCITLIFIYLGFFFVKNTKIILIVTSILFLLCLIGILWGLTYVSRDLTYKYIYYIFLSISVIATLACVLIIPPLFTNRMSEKINLTYSLLHEVYERIKNIRLVCVLPLITSILITFFVVLLFYCLIHVSTYTYPEQINDKSSKQPIIEYKKYTLTIIIEVLLIYGFFVLYLFMKNVQCMIVGGYVAQSYFTRNDAERSNPIRKILVNMCRYHLGTLCCGSFVLSIVQPLQLIFNAIKGASSGHNRQSLLTCFCRLADETCLAPLKTCLNFFSQNGFTMTAMYGCTYFTGAIRSHKLLAHNIFNAAPLYNFGDWFMVYLKLIVWFMAFFVESICAFVFYNQDVTLQFLFVLYGSTLLSYIIGDIFISVLEVTKDTLFVCFCEDCLYNDGASKPYLMSPQFAQFMENANLFTDAQKWKIVAESWSKGPKRLY